VADRTYVMNEIVGTSTEDVNQAIRNGVRRASQTLRNLDWFDWWRCAVRSPTGRFSTTR
jgi:flavin-binding protein dodecin